LRQGEWLLTPFILVFAVWAQLAMQEELHDGVHYRLLKARWANEWLSRFYGYSIGLSLEQFRQLHLRHHRYFGVPDDPDYIWYAKCPVGTSGWFVFLARNFLVINAIVGLTHADLPSKIDVEGSLFAKIAVQLVLLLILAVLIHPLAYFVFWLIPLFTLSYGIGKTRTLLEHWNPDSWTHPITGTQAIGAFFNFESGIQSQLFGAPFGYNYHATHHQIPSIPNVALTNLPDDYPEIFPAFLVKNTTYFARIRDVLRYSNAQANT
jgi:fatty acid desaturase